MPRRKRNRKNNNRNKNEKSNHQNVKEVTKNNIQANNEPEVVKPENSFLNVNIDNIITPIQATPSPKIPNTSISLRKHNGQSPRACVRTDPDETTPVNHRRSFKRNKQRTDATPNFSSINILFNLDSSPFDVHTSRSQTIVSPAFRKSVNIRSSSSIPKLHSPGLEKAKLTASVATQTSIEKRDIGVQYGIDLNEEPGICETPKISQALLLDEVETPQTLKDGVNIDINDLQDVKLLHNFEKTEYYNKMLNTDCLKTKKAQQIENLITKNPYLKLKNSSDAELSFFNPQLYGSKSASTPITNIPNDKVIVDIGKSPERIASCKCSTPKNLDNCSVSLSYDVLANKRRMYKSLSPKHVRHFNHNKFYGRSHNISLLRYKSPLMNTVLSAHRKLSVERNVIGNYGIGVKLIAKIKEYGRYTAKWSMKLVELCSALGIAIKKVRSLPYFAIISSV